MSQQTGIDRVVPYWHRWLKRWPTPTALAQAPVAEAIQEWGRLGYPRRARWLHTSAQLIVSEHHGQVPATEAELLALPGIGDYTANAILSFSFRQRRVVLDTNIRRVLHRWWSEPGTSLPATTQSQERNRMEALLPRTGPAASAWVAAVMEVGALRCTAKNPDCPACPLQRHCRWWLNAKTATTPAEAPRAAYPSQRYVGTDRYVRGLILEYFRSQGTPAATTLSRDQAAQLWPSDPAQLERALGSLVADDLLAAGPNGYHLPTA